jgi:hypothetical protein
MRSGTVFRLEIDTSAFTDQPPRATILGLLTQTKVQLRGDDANHGELTHDGAVVGTWEYTEDGPSWTKMLADARKLPDDELQRHASVSTGSNHTCQQCFTCACAAVVLERLSYG